MQRILTFLQWYRFRSWLWGRWFIRYPAKPGWKALVQDVSSAGFWRGPDGVVGAPLEWSMLKKNDAGMLEPVEDICAWTGQKISGGMPQIGETEKIDFSHSGVRCARCGVRIHILAAGMATVIDVPSCPPCRKAVRKAMHE